MSAGGRKTGRLATAPKSPPALACGARGSTLLMSWAISRSSFYCRSLGSNLDLFRPIRFESFHFDLEDAVLVTCGDLVRVDAERQLNRAGIGAVGALSTMPFDILLHRRPARAIEGQHVAL